jgi:hypothetical protein
VFWRLLEPRTLTTRERSDNISCSTDCHITRHQIERVRHPRGIRNIENRFI